MKIWPPTDNIPIISSGDRSEWDDNVQWIFSCRFDKICQYEESQSSEHKYHYINWMNAPRHQRVASRNLSLNVHALSLGVAPMPAARYDLNGGLLTCLRFIIYREYLVIVYWCFSLQTWYSICIFFGWINIVWVWVWIYFRSHWVWPYYWPWLCFCCSSRKRCRRGRTPCRSYVGTLLNW